MLRFTSAFTSNGSTQTGQLILRGTGAGQIDQGLPQLGTGGLNKNDAGTWTLGGSGNFTGPTIITAGTLSLNSATALQFSPFNTASVAGSCNRRLEDRHTHAELGWPHRNQRSRLAGSPLHWVAPRMLLPWVDTPA